MLILARHIHFRFPVTVNRDMKAVELIKRPKLKDLTTEIHNLTNYEKIAGTDHKICSYVVSTAEASENF